MIDQPWFRVESVTDRVHKITEPAVAELLRCNIWCVQGRDGTLVIDTGIGVMPLRGAFAPLAEKHVSVVLTHAHVDHMGGAHEFDSIAIHPNESDWLREGWPEARMRSSLWFTDEEISSMQRAGYEIEDSLLSSLPYPEFDLDAPWMIGATASRLLQEGHIVDLGDRHFEVMELPGHSPGSIGLWEPTTATLFSGDAVYDGALLDDLDGSNIEAYCQTMERLRGLPVSVVHAGHDDSFGRDRLIEICNAYLRSHS